MVLVITSQQDFTTTILIDWLLHSLTSYYVLAENDILSILKIDIEKAEYIVETNKGILNLHEIEAILIRKGELIIETDGNTELDSLFSYSLRNYFKQEVNVIKIFLQFILNKKKSFNSFFTQGINKLIALSFAKDAGFSTPKTIITTQKDILHNFGRDQEIITKAIYEALFITEKAVNLKNYTSVVKKKDLDRIENSFFPSLFQQKIDKKYELRVFYFDNTCHAMAIFSQHDQQTAVDFRFYNHTKPNRTVPYKLPKQVQNKIKKFMNFCHLSTGSIDMAVDKDDNYIFFEVNPVGQFGMVSEPCNYMLEKEIVNFLTLKSDAKK